MKKRQNEQKRRPKKEKQPNLSELERREESRVPFFCLLESRPAHRPTLMAAYR